MSIPALLNSFYRPVVTTADLRFMVVGDGKPGSAQPPAPDMERVGKGTPYYMISALAQNTDTLKLVGATRTAGAAFIVGDNRADGWQYSNASGYTGFVERLHWVEEWQIFIGQSAIGATHSVVIGQANGLTWMPQLPDAAYQKTHSGFAFSPTLVRAVVALEGNSNLLVFDSANWYPVNVAGLNAASIIWSTANNAFLAFSQDSQIVKISTDGLTWTDFAFAIPVPCGTVAGSFAAYSIATPGGERILIFTEGGTAPAWYSDDNGMHWSACSGMDNTGSVTRYVAVDSNAVYVAFNAELNKGMISMDYGLTWERSDHLSGNASGVITLN